MEGNRSKWLSALVAVAMLGTAAKANAFDAQQYSTAVDPTGFYSVYSSQTGFQGRTHFSLWFNYGRSPVHAQGFLTDPTGGSVSPGTRVAKAIYTLELVASYSILDWLEIGVNAPFSELSTDIEGLKHGVSPDDVRLMAKVRILDSNRFGGFGLAAVPFVEAPAGNDYKLTSQEEWNGGGLLVADFTMDRFRFALNGGYRMNEDAEFQIADLNAGEDEILFGGAAGVTLIEKWKDAADLKIEIMGEAFGSTTTDDPFSDEYHTPAEFLAGPRFSFPFGVYATLGAGTSITDSINAPCYRVVGAIDYVTPPPPPPPQPKVVVTDEQLVTLEPIYFDFDKSTIKPVSYPILDQVAKVMSERPNMRIRVEGHTDSVGSDSYNQKLSERRTQSVVRYLVGKGVDASRLQAVGFGESRPIATNDTAEGRAKNRRTEFHVVK